MWISKTSSCSPGNLRLWDNYRVAISPILMFSRVIVALGSYGGKINSNCQPLSWIQNFKKNAETNESFKRIFFFWIGVKNWLPDKNPNCGCLMQHTFVFDYH